MARRRVTQILADQGQASERADLLAAKEPLGIRVSGRAISMTMRMPGEEPKPG
jgi:hypothetical protein